MGPRLPVPRCHALSLAPWPRGGWRAVRWALFLCLGGPLVAQASSLSFCEHPVELNPSQQDHLLRFAAAVKAELEGSGQRVALVARSGQDLHRIGQRYSHAGVSLLASPNTPWSVRQLYYACEEKRPRIFDQGMAGFVMGTANPDLGYISLVLLPAESAPQAQALEQAALDKRQALSILATRYSANAYAFSDLYQNCNQWVAELLATAWSPLAGTALPQEPSSRAEGAPEDDASSSAPSRASLQAWLQAQGYQPTSVELGWAPLIWAAHVIPFVNNDDHPEADLAARRYRVSLPTALENFVHAQVPGALRIELCHSEHHIVIHRSWSPLAEGCQPGEGDEVQALDGHVGSGSQPTVPEAAAMAGTPTRHGNFDAELHLN